MKKLTLFFPCYCRQDQGSLVACTDKTNKESELIEETTKENDVHVNSQDTTYVIPEGSWDLSTMFEHTVTYESGEEGSYTVIGNKNTFGFTGPVPILSKDAQKYMWFYFGNESIYDKPVELKALKKGTAELVNISSGTFYKSAKVSPDSVNMPSRFKFPTGGVWKLFLYIEGHLFESIVVQVEQ